MLKTNLFCLIILLCIVIISGCGIDERLQASMDAFDIAVEAYEKGDYEEAVEQLYLVIERDPNYETAVEIFADIYWSLINEIEEHYNNGEYDEAQEVLNMLENMGMLEDEESFSTAIEWNSKVTAEETSKYYISGMEHYEKERYQEALKDMEKVLESSQYYEDAQVIIKEISPIIKQINEQEFKKDCDTYEYRVLNKDALTLKGEKIEQKGRVLQIIEDSYTASIRLAVAQTSRGWSSSDIVYVVYYGSTTIYEDDIITVYGTIDGFHTYTSVAGHQITLPKIIAHYYEK